MEHLLPILENCAQIPCVGLVSYLLICYRNMRRQAKFNSKKQGAAECFNHHFRYVHITIEPSILYFGTPVILLSTLNDDSYPNLAPMSSVWWLGWNCMIGLGAKGHTA